ncbi:putative porin [Microbulbifer sp. VTAC004]|uniref:putative porin n=1 Tax=Microbulbifer sp. VTAC004 TaxID=3243386 RepID=UPI0040391155
MKLRVSAFLLVFFSAVASAEEYKSITTAGYSNLDFDSGSGDDFSVETTYYFSGKDTLGPLKEFEFINKSSNISAAYYHRNIGDWNNDNFAFAGEYFAENGFLVSANLTDFTENSFNTIALGYLFTPNFLMKLYNTEGDTYVEARYNYQLNSTDYIGFGFVADELFDWQLFSSKYFAGLGDNKYLAADFSYLNIDGGDNYWKVGTDYYFTQNTSFGIDYDRNNDYKLGFSHFFNRNIAVDASYSTILENVFKHSSFGNDIYAKALNPDVDVKKFELGVTVQF